MDSTLACLAAWMPRQRWYAAKARPPSLRLVSWWELPPPTDADTAADEAAGPSANSDARIRTYLVADEGSLPAVLYQIPVVARATETVTADPDHVIGSPEPGTTFIDGPFDPPMRARSCGWSRAAARRRGRRPGSPVIRPPAQRRATWRPPVSSRASSPTPR